MIAEYVERNGLWLRAFGACMVLVAAPTLLAYVDPDMASERWWLSWVPPVGLTLGIGLLGFGLAMAQTKTARIVKSALLGLLVIITALMLIDRVMG